MRFKCSREYGIELATSSQGSARSPSTSLNNARRCSDLVSMLITSLRLSSAARNGQREVPHRRLVRRKDNRVGNRVALERPLGRTTRGRALPKGLQNSLQNASKVAFRPLNRPGLPVDRLPGVPLGEVGL